MTKRNPFAFMVMITLAFMCILLFGGCGSYPTLEELEAEALRTGDWTLVERREDRLKSKAVYQEFTEYCHSLKGSYFLLCEISTGRLRTARDIRRSCSCATVDPVWY